MLGKKIMFYTFDIIQVTTYYASNLADDSKIFHRPMQMETVSKTCHY